jgi:hypothetical protein
VSKGEEPKGILEDELLELSKVEKRTFFLQSKNDAASRRAFVGKSSVIVLTGLTEEGRWDDVSINLDKSNEPRVSR